MQFLFIIAAFLLTFGLLISGLIREEPPLNNESQAIILDMASWHKAAVQVCVTSACSTGVIDATSELPAMLASNSARLQAMFETMYDGSSKNIVTFLRPGALNKFDGPTFQTVNAQIRSTVQNQTSSLGVFDQATSKIVPTYFDRLGYEKTVPSSISGSIANGSVVIMTKM